MKERWMAVSITTVEALKACVNRETMVFCIENPLYNELKGRACCNNCFKDYEINEYPEEEIIMMKRVRGSQKFDDEHFEIYYVPLENK